MRPLTLVLILGSVSLNAVGQLFFKQGMSGGRVDVGSLLSLRAFLSPFILAGLICYGLSLVLWLIILSDVPLSLAYPMVSLGYVLVVVASMVLLGESVSATRWLAVLLICAGVVLLARS
jgi:multidrug transporter EmrE-like cation transporter